MNLSDQVAIISGATGVTGNVVAHRLAAAGARLALLSNDGPKLEEMQGNLALPADRLLTFTGDLLQPESAARAAQAVQEKFGRADILVHLVGGWTGGKTLSDAPLEDFQFMLNQHLWSTLHLFRAFTPALAASGRGRVIIVSSPFAQRPAAKGGPYAIAKAAQETLVLTLAQELSNTGLTANILQARTIDAAYKRIHEPSPANSSWTTPDEIAAAVAFLCSEEGGRINGARIPLYGAL